MKLEILDTRRPDVDPELIADYEALFAGGKAFMARVRRMLPQGPDESDKRYAFRAATAHYLNYAGPIISRFPAWLFTGRLEIRREPKTDGKDFYNEIGEDCDGIGSDLTVFMRERLTRALVQKRSWILVDFPAADPKAEPPASRAEWHERGLGEGYLCPINECDVIDWECDDRGELLMAVVKHRDTRRKSLGAGRDIVTDTWTVWTRDTWERYRVTYEAKKPPQPNDDIPLVDKGDVATKGRVPLVRLEVPDELWIMNLLASPQLEQTRARNAESWGLARTCYAMRILKLAEERELGVHGSGYGLVLGINESVEWDAPPSEAFGPIAAYSERTKEELHRVASQMAYGVNNSAGAVGRSGESKDNDNKLFDIVLGAFGQLVCSAVEKVHDLLSLGRGDEHLEWHVSGLDAFDVENANDLLTNVAMAQTINIPSPTFQRLMMRRAALAMVPDASDVERDRIVAEIDAAMPSEQPMPEAKPKRDAETKAEGEEEPPASQRESAPQPAAAKGA